jgi:Ankyrin repeats (3 copies)
LVLDACYSNHLELLEVLDQNGFDLNSTNKKGETPLHRAVYWYSEGCTMFLLKRFLGQFYIPLDAKREKIVARTPDKQRHVEDSLNQRDAEGRTPLIAATFKGNSNNAKLLIYNLLGPLAILENEEVEPRTELEQQEVERLLGVSDADGCTALHYTMTYLFNFDLLEVILENLLGNYFIDGTMKPIQRTLVKQKQIAHLVQPKNKKGKTPLLYGVIFNNEYVYKKHLLFLRNLLGEYLVEKDGTTIRPVEARTDEENQFVRSVMFSEDYEGRSLYGLEQTDEEYCENLKLLYEANASYLLPKKPQK